MFGRSLGLVPVIAVVGHGRFNDIGGYADGAILSTLVAGSIAVVPDVASVLSGLAFSILCSCRGCDRSKALGTARVAL